MAATALRVAVLARTTGAQLLSVTGVHPAALYHRLYPGVFRLHYPSPGQRGESLPRLRDPHGDLRGFAIHHVRGLAHSSRILFPGTPVFPRGCLGDAAAHLCSGPGRQRGGQHELDHDSRYPHDAPALRIHQAGPGGVSGARLDRSAAAGKPLGLAHVAASGREARGGIPGAGAAGQRPGHRHGDGIFGAGGGFRGGIAAEVLWHRHPGGTFWRHCGGAFFGEPPPPRLRFPRRLHLGSHRDRLPATARPVVPGHRRSHRGRPGGIAGKMVLSSRSRHGLHLRHLGRRIRHLGDFPGAGPLCGDVCDSGAHHAAQRI